MIPHNSEALPSVSQPGPKCLRLLFLCAPLPGGLSPKRNFVPPLAVVLSVLAPFLWPGFLKTTWVIALQDDNNHMQTYFLVPGMCGTLKCVLGSSDISVTPGGRVLWVMVQVMCCRLAANVFLFHCEMGSWCFFWRRGMSTQGPLPIMEL